MSIPHDQVEGKRLLEDVNHRVFEHSSHQSTLDFGTGGVAASMEHPTPAMRRFATEQQFPGRALPAPVELGAEGEQPIDGGRSGFDQSLHGRGVGEAGTRGQGVRFVQAGGVVPADRGREAALGVASVALAEGALGQQRDPGPRREAEGERQPGDPGSDDHDVVPSVRQVPVRDRGEQRDRQGRIGRQRTSAGGEHGVSVPLTRSREGCPVAPATIGRAGLVRGAVAQARRTKPRSVTRAAGMTERAMKARRPNGEGRVLPRLRAAVSMAA